MRLLACWTEEDTSQPRGLAPLSAGRLSQIRALALQANEVSALLLSVAGQPSSGCRPTATSEHNHGANGPVEHLASKSSCNRP